MEAIRSWGICVIVCVLTAAVMQLLFPNVRKERSVRLLIGVFLVCAVLSPFLSGDGLKFEIPELSAAEAEEELEQMNLRINQTLESQAQSKVDAVVRSILDEYQVEDVDVEVQTDILNDGHIQIGEIVISSSEKKNWNEISERITKETGCPVTVMQR